MLTIFYLSFNSLEVYSVSIMKMPVIILLSYFMVVESSANDIFNEVNKVLPAEKVFLIENSQTNKNFQISWTIKDGYYMYLDSIKVKNNQNDVLYKITKSTQSIYEDEFFGETLILKDSFIISLDKLDFDEESSLYVLYQGCSEAGFCYPVQKNYLRQ